MSRTFFEKFVVPVLHDSIPILQSKSVRRILDLGSGEGRAADFLARQGFEVVTVDSSRRTRAGHGQVCAYGEKLPFGDGTFDASLVSFVLHTMPASNRCRLLTEAARVCSTGGLLMLLDYMRPGLAMSPSQRLAWAAICLDEWVIGLREPAHFRNFREFAIRPLDWLGSLPHRQRRSVDLPGLLRMQIVETLPRYAVDGAM